MERSVRFYCEAFGMTERFRRGDGLVSLNTPGTKDSISLNFDPADERPKGEMGTVAHFGFRLADPDDLDAAIKEPKIWSTNPAERRYLSEESMTLIDQPLAEALEDTGVSLTITA